MANHGTQDDHLDPADEQSRRRFLEKIAAFTGGALGYLSFPGPVRAEATPYTPPHANAGPTPNFEEFPRCGEFQQYSAGDDCTTAFTCGPSGFHCEGGALDDFECTSAFVCTQFLCSYSFDDEDCEQPDQYYCNPAGAEFACSEGYN